MDKSALSIEDLKRSAGNFVADTADGVMSTVGDTVSKARKFMAATEATTPGEEFNLTAREFLKRWGPLAGATTIGAGLAAGSLTASGDRPGESKRERTTRILRNALLTSLATGAGWAGAAGAAGLGPLIEQGVSVKDWDTKYKKPRSVTPQDVAASELFEGKDPGKNEELPNHLIFGTAGVASVAPEVAKGVSTTGKNIALRRNPLTPGVQRPINPITNIGTELKGLAQNKPIARGGGRAAAAGGAAWLVKQLVDYFSNKPKTNNE